MFEIARRLRRASLSLALAGLIPSLPVSGEVVAPPPAELAAPPATAEVSESGLASQVLQAGSGDRHPGPAAWVRVHYSGWTGDGELFDSSVESGKSLTVPLDRVLAGWSEGLQLMVEGEKRRLWIPQELAYRGQPDRPRGMLVFDIELLEIVDPPVAPADVAAPPADAEVHKRGLASKRLRAGGGERHPKSSSTVTVHYTGWKTDGTMFDSSVKRGQKASFPLNRVIKGWTEGLQLMVVGEKRRFWIPANLAYGENGRVPGMLVFDVELFEID